MSSSVWDLKAILAALREQGWTVTPTTQGRYKCVPPDPERDIVIVAETSSWTSQRNTVGDLKRSGFAWPPRAPASPASRPTTRGGGTPQAQVPLESAEARCDRLWRELAEARGYLVLVDEHLDEISRKIDEAARAWHDAQLERRSAMERLRAVKAELDKAFEGAT